MVLLRNTCLPLIPICCVVLPWDLLSSSLVNVFAIGPTIDCIIIMEQAAFAKFWQKKLYNINEGPRLQRICLENQVS